MAVSFPGVAPYAYTVRSTDVWGLCGDSCSVDVGVGGLCLQPLHEHPALCEQGGDLGHVGERWVRLGYVAGESSC
jgi:hypothetical protein